ncbi:MAG: DUF1080 domain-containing protein [Cryomorphaceae bacterium]|mgnify:FL=1|jgi:hypothetical protein|nr:DUF1080 domain-containing protein [Cryomorphaceae bacterium]MBT4222810.1 DUF1080 domain-containing protein [Cryomorphaceae bacterium]MBT4293371.1 DUF1080 domain-containing protein [Cryomorphaceae bacterium]MBT4517058.1 DUF1080 domain-containing protein [Cryomorphaceae bacterium]MBT4834164.1 DUF1080 domain-containing protein [Cryomorphaceae bacterium]
MINKMRIAVYFFLFFNFSFSQSVSLFNGIDLSGWTIHGTEKWYVENGDLVCENGPDNEYGYLSTDKYYNDFILTLEYKQESNGNSGVFFRSTLEGIIINGWQVEISPPGHDTGGIYESYGRGWLIKPDPIKDKSLKYGDWNSMKIMVKGDNVKTWLNGVEMIHIKDQKIGEGKGSIALQIHAGDDVKVRWRNIKLERL